MASLRGWRIDGNDVRVEFDLLNEIRVSGILGLSVIND